MSADIYITPRLKQLARSRTYLALQLNPAPVNPAPPIVLPRHTMASVAAFNPASWNA